LGRASCTPTRTRSSSTSCPPSSSPGSARSRRATTSSTANALASEQKLLNHVETGITRVYDRASYDREKQAALNAWAARLEQIVSDEPVRGKVLAFRA
jgi:hypothetical protein